MCKRLVQILDDSLGGSGVSASIGIAQTGPENFSDMDSLVRTADKAMYEAKANSRTTPGSHIATADSKIPRQIAYARFRRTSAARPKAAPESGSVSIGTGLAFFSLTAAVAMVRTCADAPDKFVRFAGSRHQVRRGAASCYRRTVSPVANHKNTHGRFRSAGDLERSRVHSSERADLRRRHRRGRRVPVAQHRSARRGTTRCASAPARIFRTSR